LAICRATDSGKSSRRRRSWISRAALALVVCAASAAGQETSSASSDGAEALDAFLADVRTLTADFRQQLWTADQRLLQTDTGTFSLSRPNRFRWTYREPSELTIVADGAELWIYDVELEQVTVAPFDESLSSSPAMLLSGDRSVRDGFDVEATYSADGLDWVKLVPKVGGSEFTSLSIGFSGTSPRRLELVDGLKQVTTIEFERLTLNPELAPEVFEFTPPANVEVIGGEG
jgi:outer membrane lipoprotein carrier protein